MVTIPLREVSEDGAADAAEFKPLTAEQAQALRRELRSVSPWMVLAVQCGVGALVSLLVAWWVSRTGAAWSVAYGALTVVLPGALLARGLSSRTSAANAGAAALGFMVWELVKLAVTVAMLVAAPRVVTDLSWPWLLLGLVLTMKVYWVALLWRRKRQD